MYRLLRSHEILSYSLTSDWTYMLVGSLAFEMLSGLCEHGNVYLACHHKKQFLRACYRMQLLVLR